jgi:SAM-dependent methyltransferase
MLIQKNNHEIAHGKLLAERDTELIWGWGTPAGRLRAERRAQLIIRGGRLEKGKQVLEVGCGTGMFTEMFSRTGARILGVDISGDLLKKARARDLPLEQVEFLEKRFEDCGTEGPFDAVIGSSILHHLEITSALNNIYGLLKPGGWLSFAEPNMLNPQVFLERNLKFIKPLFWYVSPDETAFVRGKLSKALQKAGFNEICIIPFDWLHPFTPPSIIPAVKRFGDWLEKIPVFREFSGSLIMLARRPS